MIFAIIGAVVGVAVIRNVLRQRRADKDMARRIIPNGPPRVWPVDCSAAGIARIREAGRVEAAKVWAEGEALIARLNADQASRDAAAANFEAANPYWRLQMYAPKGVKL